MPRRTQVQPEIHRGRFDRLTIYEVSADELELLAQGAPNATYLNFAIAFLSIASSFMVTLPTTEIKSDRTFTVFVVLSAVGTGMGVVLLAIWYRGSRSMKDLIDRIRRRLPPPGVSEQTPTAQP